MDKSIPPCTDFYQYACGAWIRSNPLPADRSSYGRFDELDQRNKRVLQDLLESAALVKETRTPLDQKLGDHYAACIDEAGVNKRGIEPLRPEIERINAMKAKQALTAVIGQLHKIGVGVLFTFHSAIDLKNSTQVIAEIDQGGLGLPDRDYYIRTDEKSVELRKLYIAHVARFFQLAGSSEADSLVKAAAAMRIETELAKASLDNVARREAERQHHPYRIAELISLNPGIDWEKYFESLGRPGLTTMNITHPPFVRRVEEVIVTSTLDDMKAYLTWHLLLETAGVLPTAFIDENFNFFGKILNGAKQLQPRWRRCINLVDQQMGDALAKKYVDNSFGPQANSRMRVMIQALTGAMARDIDSLPWMTPDTKKAALEKLRAVSNKIGFPEKWKSYEVPITRDDLISNAIRLSELKYQRDLDKIGRPVDKGEWEMTAPTVNAYADPQRNSINFPAGILQRPFFDEKADDASNFGAIGAVIGHELTHLFDDEGRKFDAEGNLRDWWTDADGTQFERLSACFVDQYAQYSPVEGVKLNGRLTLGENVADNGGLRIAYSALLSVIAPPPSSRTPKGSSQRRISPGMIDGLTPQQRFFVAWAQSWCSNVSEANARLRANVDPHSPGKDRVNGVVSNMPEFKEAFRCSAGQPMVREPACRVW